MDITILDVERSDLLGCHATVFSSAILKSSGGIMEVLVSLIGDEAGDETRRLTRWLQEDGDLRSARIQMMHTQGEPGDMGIEAELIQVAFQEHGVLVALAGVLGTWIGTRRRTIKLRVRVGKREVEIDASKLEDPDEVAIRLLRELVDD
jgi:hypothetical protein